MQFVYLFILAFLSRDLNLIKNSIKSDRNLFNLLRTALSYDQDSGVVSELKSAIPQTLIKKY